MRSASARCSTEYQKAPAVTRDRLYIETMQQVYSNVSKVMVDSRNGSNLLYLPLDKLLQQAGVPGAATATAPAGAATPAPRRPQRRRRALARRRPQPRPRGPLKAASGEQQHEPHRIVRRQRC